jgi:small GTP-binding protein
VGIDFNVRDATRGGQVYRLQMWDTAGQERYRSLIPTYLKNAQCAVFVYDVTRPSSLQNVQMWQKLFHDHQDAPGVLVGNKTDLSAARKVSREEGEEAAARLKMRHFEVSAKSGKRVGDLFEDILELLLEERKKEEQFVESTREKLKDLRTIQEEGVEAPRDEAREGPITLKSRALEIARNINCCSSTG